MKASLYASVSCLLLVAAAPAWAAEASSSTITNLPATDGSGYQVYGLNSKGQVAGYFYVAGVHGQHAFLYDSGTLNDLGTLGGTLSVAYSINGAGDMAGQANLSEDLQQHAFLYHGGAMLDLGTLGGSFSTAAWINDSRQVVGNSTLSGDGATEAFLYAGSEMTGLGDLGGGYSAAYVINNSGVVIGDSYLANGDLHGFIYSGSGMSDLRTLGGTYSSAYGINDAGLVVGESTVAGDFEVHAFAWSAGTMRDLGTLGGTYSSASFVNSNSQVVGFSTITGDGAFHGFIHQAGTMTDLGVLDGINSVPRGVNNLGKVVGYADTATGSTHAFVWDNGTMTDLNTLLPTDSGWELTSAEFVNDGGRIVGFGSYQGLSQWFVMDLTTASSNQPPVAVTGPDQNVECGSEVTLDGSASSDPDGDTLTFEWSQDGTVLGTASTLTVSLPLGTNVLTLKVTDPSGSSSQTNVSVVVADTTPPAGSCPSAATATADANCQAAIPDLRSQVIASDTCPSSQGLVITQSPAPGTLIGVGEHPIAVTVTDGSGNSSTCTVLFTVRDTTPPVIVSAPALLTVSAGANGEAPVPSVVGNIVATDNCTPANQLVISQNPVAGTAVGLGEYPITVSVADAAGNSSSASVSLKVIDTTPPSIVSLPGPLTASTDANCQAVVPNVVAGVVATDNCTPAGELMVSQSPAAGTLVGPGTLAIAVTVTDAAGNSAHAQVSLNVLDTTAPTILTSSGPITISADDHCQGVVPDLRASVLATDNCTPANQLIVTQNPPAGTQLARGSYQVTITVTDLAGNSTSVQVPLTVADSTAPVIQALWANPSVLNPPNHQMVPVTLSANVTDNCDAAPYTRIVSVTCNQPTSAGDIQVTGDLTVNLAASKGTSASDRVYTIMVAATDASQNIATAAVTVSVTKDPKAGTAKSVLPLAKAPKTSALAKR